jgi:hypothetical protein
MKQLLFAAALLISCLDTPEPRAPQPGHVARWEAPLIHNDWLAEFTPKPKGRFGLDNVSLESESDGALTSFLRVMYWKGSASPSASRRAGVKEGGAQWLGELPTGPTDRAFLRYYVRFAGDFEFVKGGKLPGFYGGTQVSGGNIPDGTNGFSSRFMWRSAGQGEVYLYMPSSTRFGTSVGRGSFVFQPGKWHCLEQELQLNTPGALDGQVRVWLDGERVFEQGALFFRTVADLRIEGLFFSTFFGGGDPSWAPPRDTHADFAAFAIAGQRIGCEQRARGAGT